MLEKILILLNQLLWSKPTILIEQVNFQDLLLVLSISWTKQCSNNKWEEVSECSKSNICCENVVIVWIKELSYCQNVPITNQYQMHIGNIFVFQLLGMAWYHPIKLNYYQSVRSDGSRVKALAGTYGARLLATWSKSIIFLTLCNLWILVYLERGKFWSRRPKSWVKVK